MKPQIALTICLLFIIYVYKLEFKWYPNVSRTLWVPTIWIMIVGSRYLSYWFNISNPATMADAVIEGSPFDRIVFLGLNFAGMYILYKNKNVKWVYVIINKNFWILMFFIYGGISVLWSEIPYVLIKRLFKSMGNPIMALIILSEHDPLESIKTILRRCAYVLLPLSIIFIKYYPDIGRQYHVTGEVMYRGVTGQKNELGLICLFFTLTFFWSIIKRSNRQDLPYSRKEILVYITFLCLGFWLLLKSDSATALLCFIVGLCIIMATELRFIKRNVDSIHVLIFVGIIVFIIGMVSLNLKEVVVTKLGRDSSLTTRVPVWEFLLGMGTNPIIGTGFESFWTVKRTRLVEEAVGVHSVHNGYLDIYLNLGFIGIVLFAVIIVTAYRKISKELKFNYDFGVFKLMNLIIILLYSYSEAYLTGINLVFFMFFFVSMKIPSLYQNTDQQTIVFQG